MADPKKDREKQVMEAARRDAELFARDKSKEQIQNELDRMDRRPGFFSWLRDRVNAVINFAKITAMSIVLGRRETARRIDLGTAAEEREKSEKALANSVKREVLLTKLKEKDNQEKGAEEKTGPEKPEPEKPEPEKPEPEKPEPEKPEPEKSEPEKSEPENEDPQQGEHPDQEQPEQPKEPEKATEPQKPEKPIKETILAQQCREMTETYRDGLSRYIENITGIDRQYFSVNSVDGKIRIDFEEFNNLAKGKDNPYRNGVTMDSRGCVQEHKNPISKAIGTAILYYTAEVYRDSKNQTQFPGTRPSNQMISETIGRLTAKLEANEKAGGPPKNFSAPLFGHVLTIGRGRGKSDKDAIFLSIDGEKGKTGEKESLEKWAKGEITARLEGHDKATVQDYTVNEKDGGVTFSEYTRGVGGDYGKIPEYRKEFHTTLDEMTARGDIPETCVKKYTEAELRAEFDGRLQAMLTDGRTLEGPDGERKPDLSRGFDFGAAHFHVELEEKEGPDGKTELTVGSVIMTSPDRNDPERESVSVSYIYGEFGGIDANNGYNENIENISGYMANGYIIQYGEQEIELENAAHEPDDGMINPFVDDRQEMDGREMMHEVDELDFDL